MWDILTNMDLSYGRANCHSALDILLTPDGDLAICTGDLELRQRFVMYRATPKGERLNPLLGCAEYDYLHEKNVSTEMRKMSQDIYADLQAYFPEMKGKSVTCELSEEDAYKVNIYTLLAVDNINFLFNAKSLMNISSTLDNILHAVF